MAGQLVGMLAEAMNRKRWREADLVRETGLTQSRINRLLRGATRDPEPDLFREVARALDLSVEAVVQAHAEDMRAATLARVLGAPEVALAGASGFPRRGDSARPPAGGLDTAERHERLGPADEPVPAWGVALMQAFAEMQRTLTEIVKRTAAPVLAGLYIMHGGTRVEAMEIRPVTPAVAASCDAVALRMSLISLWRRLRARVRSLAVRHVFHLRLVTYGTPTWAA